ncbi:metallophosphoesterase [Cupriavidus necator]
MKPLYVLNDVHIGVTRSAGTTPTSAYALRQRIIERFGELLEQQVGNCHLLINGDLFDEYQIPQHDLLKTYMLLTAWLADYEDASLTLGLGNHDLSKDSTKLSSAEFLGHLLERAYPDRVQVVKGSAALRDGMYMISHVPNQDLFDMELEAVPEGTTYLFLHANYDNGFAAESDHSLNVSEEQARKLADRGVTLVFGHEHQGKQALGGKVLIVGNQIPSSVADCLGNSEKFMLRITDTGPELEAVWFAHQDFARVDWEDLASYQGDAMFIRVEGKADAAQAADVVSVISKFRSKSSAFVVTNAVRIGETDVGEDLKITAEDVRSFDVLGALVDLLTEEEGAVVKSELEKSNAQ